MFGELDRERRRIEAALHHGVQQDLIAASVGLQFALQLFETDPPAALARLEELEQQIQDALERVRTLSHQIYPSILEARGLGDALRASGIEIGAVGRYELEIEEAVYFACRAILPGATHIRVWCEDDALRLEAAGAFDQAALAHARARVTAVGGQFAVSAGGAEVIATVPVAPSAR